MSACDRSILGLLFHDPVSPVHSFLPTERRFGITGLAPDDHLVIVKMGSRIDIVSQQTGAIYQPVSADGPLVRIDRNNVFGPEYRIDPFGRKDSLFTLATSRFMRGKGFLAYFDTTVKEWKPYRGNDHDIKESTKPFFDPVNDQLYLVCNYPYDDKADSSLATMDNVLRFSFSSGTWEELGRLDGEVFTSALTVPVRLNWESPFGAGNFEGGDLNVLQMGRNRWLSTDTAFARRLETDLPMVSDTSKLLQVIYMGDTLYAFTGTVDSVQVARIPLHESDFTVIGGKALYEKMNEPESRQPGSDLVIWGLSLLGLSVLVYVAYKLRKGKLRSAVGPDLSGSVSKGRSEAEVPAPPIPVKQPVHYFLGSLSPVERSLIRELSSLALKNDLMDTHALNQIIGVSHKEPELQKVRRSLTITRINSNFGQMIEPDVPLIRRSKDPVDKRVFQYFVTKEHARMLLAADAESV